MSIKQSKIGNHFPALDNAKPIIWKNSNSRILQFCSKFFAVQFRRDETLRIFMMFHISIMAVVWGGRGLAGSIQNHPIKFQILGQWPSNIFLEKMCNHDISGCRSNSPYHFFFQILTTALISISTANTNQCTIKGAQYRRFPTNLFLLSLPILQWSKLLQQPQPQNSRPLSRTRDDEKVYTLEMSV